MGINVKDVLVLLILIAVILWVLSYFDIINLAGIVDWLRNLFYGIMN